MTDLDIKYYSLSWPFPTIYLPENRDIIRNIAFLLLVLYCQVGYCQQWKVESSSVTFKIKHAFGSTAEGSFKGLTSSIFFDTNQISKSSLRVSLEAQTINTGLGLRDKALRGSKYLDIEKYPQIRVTSTNIEPSAAQNEYIGTFELSMKDKVKRIKIPFMFVSTENHGLFKATFQLNRLDFGIGESSALLGDTVTILVTLNTIAI